jgi:hypothetical protein
MMGVRWLKEWAQSIRDRKPNQPTYALADAVSTVLELFDETMPCSIPEPQVLPGIGKIEISDDAAGLWDIDDAEKYAVQLLLACDRARRGER